MEIDDGSDNESVQGSIVDSSIGFDVEPLPIQQPLQQPQVQYNPQIDLTPEEQNVPPEEINLPEYFGSIPAYQQPEEEEFIPVSPIPTEYVQQLHAEETQPMSSMEQDEDKEEFPEQQERQQPELPLVVKASVAQFPPGDYYDPELNAIRDLAHNTELLRLDDALKQCMTAHYKLPVVPKIVYETGDNEEFALERTLFYINQRNKIVYLNARQKEKYFEGTLKGMINPVPIKSGIFQPEPRPAFDIVRARLDY
jgi:hypothetical protein